MVGFDAGEHGQVRAQGLEGAVTLVGLDDEPVPSSQTAFVPISLTSAPITNDGRRPASTRMSASMDAVVVLPCVPATARQRRVAQMAASTSERGATRMPRAMRLAQLRILGLHRRGVRHGVGALHVLGLMPDRDANPAGAQALGHRRILQVRARDAMTHVVQDQRDGAHPGAADADDVDPPRPGEVEGRCVSGHGRRPVRRPGRPRRDARARGPRRAWREAQRVRQQRVELGGEPCAVALVVGQVHRGPRSTSASALRVWWSRGAPGNGTKIAGTPASRSSATVMAPARVTHTSAAP